MTDKSICFMLCFKKRIVQIQHYIYHLMNSLTLAVSYCLNNLIILMIDQLRHQTYNFIFIPSAYVSYTLTVNFPQKCQTGSFVLFLLLTLQNRKSLSARIYNALILHFWFLPVCSYEELSVHVVIVLSEQTFCQRYIFSKTVGLVVAANLQQRNHFVGPNRSRLSMVVLKYLFEDIVERFLCFLVFVFVAFFAAYFEQNTEKFYTLFFDREANILKGKPLKVVQNWSSQSIGDLFEFQKSENTLYRFID